MWTVFLVLIPYTHNIFLSFQTTIPPKFTPTFLPYPDHHLLPEQKTDRSTNIESVAYPFLRLHLIIIIMFTKGILYKSIAHSKS